MHREIKTYRKSCVVTLSTLFSLPLMLPPGEIVHGVSDIRSEIADDGQQYTCKVVRLCVDKMFSLFTLLFHYIISEA